MAALPRNLNLFEENFMQSRPPIKYWVWDSIKCAIFLENSKATDNDLKLYKMQIPR